MKNALLILFILTFQLNFAQSFTFPEPDTVKIQQQTSETSHQYSDIYFYLLNNFGKQGIKDSVRFYDQSGSYCSYKQEFNNNISLRTHTCEEVGIDERIVFPKVATEEMQKLVMWFFTTKDNHWSTDLEYSPIEEGPGCYIEIIQYENSTVLKYYCGC